MRTVRRWTLALVVCTASCSGTPLVDPSTPDLAVDSAAARAFAPLRLKWEHGSRSERLGLEGALLEFNRRFAKDPTARIAAGMLSLIAADKGQAEKLAALTGPLMGGPPGVTRDDASVALGVDLERKGQSRAALARLGPLFGKMLDPFARDLLNENAALAAVDLGEHDRAVVFIRAWLSEASAEDRESFEAKIKRLLARIPKEPLMGLVRSAKGTSEMQSRLLKIVGDRLIQLATSTGDVELAKFLVASARPLLGDQADPLARLAARGAAVRLEPNTVGLLLSLRSEELQKRSLDVSSGLANALGLPGSAARVVTRDDQGSLDGVEEALALLNADGAAAIIAGLDGKEAAIAQAYGERTGVPILLLHPSKKPVKSDGPVFVVGEDPRRGETAMLQGLGRLGVKRAALLVGAREDVAEVPEASGVEVVAVSPCGSVTDFISGSGATGLVIDGSPTCIVDTQRALPSAVTLALGFEAPFNMPAAVRLRAGRYPMTMAPVGDGDLDKFIAASKAPPTWWAGLGHDAGAIAWDAVRQLPEAAEGDTEAIARRKRLVVELLANAETSLWTTSARGFAATRRLERDLAAEISGKPASR